MVAFTARQTVSLDVSFILFRTVPITVELKLENELEIFQLHYTVIHFNNDIDNCLKKNNFINIYHQTSRKERNRFWGCSVKDITREEQNCRDGYVCKFHWSCWKVSTTLTHTSLCKSSCNMRHTQLVLCKDPPDERLSLGSESWKQETSVQEPLQKQPSAPKGEAWH